jgi:four helix bundle protein
MENEKNRRIREFTDLVVWQESHQLVLFIYKITGTFPQSEIFGLTNQMRRAAVSVTSNIAEGFGRSSYKEKIHFYYLSLGSLTELKNQLIISKDVSYLDVPNFEKIFAQATSVHRLLQAFITKSKSFL